MFLVSEGLARGRYTDVPQILLRELEMSLTSGSRPRGNRLATAEADDELGVAIAGRSPALGGVSPHGFTGEFQPGLDVESALTKLETGLKVDRTPVTPAARSTGAGSGSSA